MVYKSGQIFLPFCHNSRVWQTDGRTDGQTEISSQYRGCITCSAVTIRLFELINIRMTLTPIVANQLHRNSTRTCESDAQSKTGFTQNRALSCNHFTQGFTWIETDCMKILLLQRYTLCKRQTPTTTKRQAHLHVARVSVYSRRNAWWPDKLICAVCLRAVSYCGPISFLYTQRVIDWPDFSKL